jgi:hypothetical protein
VKDLKKTCALLATVLLATACPTQEPGPVDAGGGGGDDTGAGRDAGGGLDSGGGGLDADASSTDAAADSGVDACVPIDVCPPDACGMRDDGCGGTLECGACDCVDGVASEPRCGPCGLGTLTCEPDATGAGTCVAPDLAGVDVEAACGNLIYLGSDSGVTPDGSRQAPYLTAFDALSNASAPAIIVVEAGTYSEGTFLNVIEGVHIIGGFGGSEWTWEPEAVTALNIKQPPREHVAGLVANNVLTPTVLAHLEVRTGTASSNGETAIGAYFVSSAALVLSHVDVFIGDGADGADGANGMRGADGNPGANSGATTSGSGGTNSACPQANGGDGGRGAFNQNGALSGASPGGDAPGGARGGQAGTSSLPFGIDGQTLQSPPDGADGDSGRAAGSFIEGEWTVLFGDGEPGAAGLAGSGGGGGGGAFWPTDSRTNPPGESGGGGGAGGCGGAPGQGGQAGGASFGLVVFNSTGLTLNESTFTAGDGGVGGRGGDGGRGGNPGFGGDGGDTYPAASGGDGGDGVPGSDGGQGGAGAGGSSYGAWCEASNITILGQTTFTAGRAGIGGVSITPGQAGVSADQNGCQ